MELTVTRNSTSTLRETMQVYVAADLGTSLYFVDDQAWFWTESWQRGERRVDDYIMRGEFEEFDTMDEFLRSLDLHE